MKKALKVILTIISMLLVYGPACLFMGGVAVSMAMTGAGLVSISIFSASCIAFGLLTIISIASKQIYKTTPWILAFPAFMICPNLPALIIVALGLLLDDIIIEPLIPEE